MNTTTLLALEILGLVILILLGALVAGKNTEFPYEKQEGLFTQAERSFLNVLESSVGDRYRIYGKVRLADVLRVRKGLNRSRWQTAFNRISSKHLDFVLCDPRTLKIVGVLELDDRSHAAPSRQRRDAFLESALLAAQVPLVRVPARANYQPADLRRQVLAVLEP